MRKPRTKEELLVTANIQFDKLWELINDMNEQEQITKFCFKITDKDKEAHWMRDKNIRDILIHLYEWHNLAINWIYSNQKSNVIIPFLPLPYTWKNYRNMNVEFWKKHQNTSFNLAKDLLLQSHKTIISLIKNFSDDELFTKSFFNWSGTTSAASYLISATSSHYDWALKKIKRQIKALKQQYDNK